MLLKCIMLVLAVLPAMPPAQAQVMPPTIPRPASAEAERAQLERRIESVATLLERSSAAKQIDASNEPRAAERREQARQVHRRAQEAYKAGDYPKAANLLSDASALMFEAVRLAAPEKVTAGNTAADYDARVASVKALLAAQQRIAVEKPGIKGSAETTRTIEGLLTEAGRLASANHFDQARATLDRAYLIAKAAIGSMRGGDTLVRSLHFSSKEEEYRYELDRNDTHQMLIKLLLDDKRSAQETDRMVRGFIERAGKLRGRAEASASRNDHAGAVKLLEESTAELVKAIRNAGVFIPG